MPAPRKQELLRFHLDEMIRKLQESDPIFEMVDIVLIVCTHKDHKLNTLGTIPAEGICYYLKAALKQATEQEAHLLEDVSNQ